MEIYFSLDRFGTNISQEKIQSNFFRGVELESFSNKGDTIESEANVLNNNVELHMYYKPQLPTSLTI